MQSMHSMGWEQFDSKLAGYGRNERWQSDCRWFRGHFSSKPSLNGTKTNTGTNNSLPTLLARVLSRKIQIQGL
jgi:hypothetical protein